MVTLLLFIVCFTIDILDYFTYSKISMILLRFYKQQGRSKPSVVFDNLGLLPQLITTRLCDYIQFTYSANLLCALTSAAAMGLPPDEDSAMVKIHLFFLLSVVARHSKDGFEAIMDALDNYKVQQQHINFLLLLLLLFTILSIYSM